MGLRRRAAARGQRNPSGVDVGCRDVDQVDEGAVRGRLGDGVVNPAGDEEVAAHRVVLDVLRVAHPDRRRIEAGDDVVLCRATEHAVRPALDVEDGRGHAVAQVQRPIIHPVREPLGIGDAQGVSGDDDGVQGEDGGRGVVRRPDAPVRLRVVPEHPVAIVVDEVQDLPPGAGADVVVPRDVGCLERSRRGAVSIGVPRVEQRAVGRGLEQVLPRVERRDLVDLGVAGQEPTIRPAVGEPGGIWARGRPV